MPRTKEFDETEVLDKALEIFRARGFAHTSFEDLTSGLGVSRQSLYDTYGDKEELYDAALGRYLERGLARFREKLDDPAPIREVLSELFGSLVDMTCDGDGGCGCFMVNSMIELAPSDPQVRSLASRHAEGIEGLLASRMRRAQREGDLGSDKDPAALAHFFYHTILGMAVAARAFRNREALRQTVRICLQALD
jgi:TetR/AcrR family transcriptional repressor of nem operon